jgi:hypothetical protein
LLPSVAVPLKHVSMQTDSCFDAPTEGATGGLSSSPTRRWCKVKAAPIAMV